MLHSIRVPSTVYSSLDLLFSLLIAYLLSDSIFIILSSSFSLIPFLLKPYLKISLKKMVTTKELEEKHVALEQTV